MSQLTSDSSLRVYLRDISKTELLTPEEEAELAERVGQGDAEAREHMIRANLRLVVKIAQDYANNGMALVDLIAEGNIGLMTAVDRFDPDRERNSAPIAPGGSTSQSSGLFRIRARRFACPPTWWTRSPGSEEFRRS